MIRRSSKMLGDLTGINPTTVPLDDQATLSLFSSTDAIGVTPERLNSPVATYGIPEFNTSFTRQMLEDTHPTAFAELLRISRFFSWHRRLAEQRSGPHSQ